MSHSETSQKGVPELSSNRGGHRESGSFVVQQQVKPSPLLAPAAVPHSAQTLGTSPLGGRLSPANSSVTGKTANATASSISGNPQPESPHFRHLDELNQALPPPNLSFPATVQGYIETLAREAALSVTSVEHRPLPTSRKPTALTDFSDCFRLYFGSNIAIFPFIVTLGGSAFAPFITVVVAVLMHETIVSLARSQESALRLVYRDESRHDDVNTMSKLADVLWSTESTSAAAAAGTSRIPTVVKGIIFLTQFFAACEYAVLLAENLGGLTGFSTFVNLLISCVTLVVLMSFFTRGTSKYYAMLSNAGMLIAGIVLLSQAMGKVLSGEAEGAMAEHHRLTPVRWANVLLLLPILTGYLSPTLFAADVEANLRDRASHENSANPTPQHSHRPAAIAGAVSDSNRQRFLNLALAALGIALVLLLGFGSFMFWAFGDHTSAVVAFTLPPGWARTLLLLDFVVGLNANAVINVAALFDLLDSLQLASRLSSRCFPFARRPSAVGLFSGSSRRPQEEAAAAQGGNGSSAAEMNGISNSAAGGSVASPDVTRASHRFSSSTRSALLTLLEAYEPVVLRAIVFASVIVVVMVIPFYDLLTALCGAAGYTWFTFFFPVAFELRVSSLDLAASRAQSTSSLSARNARSAPPTPSAQGRDSNLHQPSDSVGVAGWVDSFLALPTFRQKVSVAAFFAVGATVMVLGTASALVEAYERRQS